MPIFEIFKIKLSQCLQIKNFQHFHFFGFKLYWCLQFNKISKTRKTNCPAVCNSKKKKKRKEKKKRKSYKTNHTDVSNSKNIKTSSHDTSNKKYIKNSQNKLHQLLRMFSGVRLSHFWVITNQLALKLA